MIGVFLSGVIGFFVFDAYRIYKESTKTGSIFVTFPNFQGISAHFIVYFAAGLLGVFVNLDVIILTLRGDADDLTGAMLRAFSLGLMGPAALAKGQQSVQSRQERGASEEVADDTPVSPATFLDHIRYSLMRGTNGR
ncbi:MAG: hypothetical protein AAF968_02320 [Pseudomonadota bacterium]